MEFIWRTLQSGVERVDIDAKEAHPEDGDGEMTYKLSGYAVGTNYRIDIKPQGQR
jgi:hypothetical protein